MRRLAVSVTYILLVANFYRKEEIRATLEALWREDSDILFATLCPPETTTRITAAFSFLFILGTPFLTFYLFLIY